jgi:phospholipase C
LDGQGVLPPSSVRSIGDALNERSISFAYYGGGYYLSLYGGPTFSEIYDPVSNPFRFQSSIMGDAKQRAAHLKDVIDLYSDIKNNTLPAVSYVKPDTLTDGHPQTSKLGRFEAFVAQLVAAVQANPQVAAETAIFITFDEGGGYYDSGFIQPLDYFGDGPRVPFIVVSPWTKGGRVVHNYADHASVVKFIERNWSLNPLTHRSRDNLPNPVPLRGNPYVPSNMPAIDDLFSMFHFVEHR